jgi:hypothetical protein
VVPHNIECYKCHNYGHIAQNYRIMIVTSMKKETYIIYTKVWKRKEQVPEQQVKEEQMPKITRLSIVRERQGKHIIMKNM